MNNENLEKIESFVNDSLTMEEKKTFQREVEENPELSEMVSKFIFTRDIIRLANIRKEVSMVHHKFMQEDYQASKQEKPKKSLIKILFGSLPMSIAASVILVLGCWSIYQLTTLNAEDLIAENQIDYTSSTFRGSVSNLGNVRGLYRNGEYEQVLQVLQKEFSPNAEMIFLKAMANFKMKNYKNALIDFQQLRTANTKTAEPSFVHELAYYEALSLIGNHDYEQAIKNLEGIKNDPNNPYRAGISAWQLFKLNLMK